MFCTQCGNKLEEQMNLCPFCGKSISKNIGGTNTVNMSNTMNNTNINTPYTANNMYNPNTNTSYIANNMYNPNINTPYTANNMHNQNMDAPYARNNMYNSNINRPYNNSVEDIEKLSGINAVRYWGGACSGWIIGICLLVMGRTMAGILMALGGILFCPLIQNLLPDGLKGFIRIVAIVLVCIGGMLV